MDVLKAALLIGVGWVLWRLPAFFYHQDFFGMDWFALASFVITSLCGSLVLTWIYNGTAGSILMSAVWYALFDLFSASSAGGDLLSTVLSFGVIVWVLVLVISRKPWGLFQQLKQTLP